MFVGNLSFDTVSEQVQELFAQVGEVVSVSIPTDRDNGRARGFAFVELATPEQAAAAIEKLNGYELGGRVLRVNEASDRPPQSSSFGRGGGLGRSPSFRPRPKGSRRNIRARKRSVW